MIKLGTQVKSKIHDDLTGSVVILERSNNYAVVKTHIDDYVMDIIKQGGIFNTIRFDDETAAGINAESWFPKLTQCPDADHYISAYVVDLLGDITWQN